jgi:hypothetical protein
MTLDVEGVVDGGVNGQEGEHQDLWGIHAAAA